MAKEFWQKNNPKIKELLKQYYEVSALECKSEDELKDKTQKLLYIKTELNQENYNSQLMWIALRSCKGIPCKMCYLNPACSSYAVKDSQKLAADIIKSKLGIKDEVNNEKSN